MSFCASICVILESKDAILGIKRLNFKDLYAGLKTQFVGLKISFCGFKDFICESEGVILLL